MKMIEFLNPNCSSDKLTPEQKNSAHSLRGVVRDKNNNIITNVQDLEKLYLKIIKKAAWDRMVKKLAIPMHIKYNLRGEKWKK